MQHPNRIRPFSPGGEAGIDEELIRSLVDRFYAKVRADAEIGPIFNAAIEDWPAHLDKLCAFWSSVTLMTGRYKGNPMQVHVRLPELDDKHFRRWLDLFFSTLGEVCTPEQCEVFRLRAERIADSFRFAIAMTKGEIARPLREVEG